MLASLVSTLCLLVVLPPPAYHEQTRAETLLAVDDMIEAVIGALKELGELDNTYM